MLLAIRSETPLDRVVCVEWNAHPIHGLWSTLCARPSACVSTRATTSAFSFLMIENTADLLIGSLIPRIFHVTNFRLVI